MKSKKSEPAPVSLPLREAQRVCESLGFFPGLAILETIARAAPDDRRGVALHLKAVAEIGPMSDEPPTTVAEMARRVTTH